MYAKVKGQTLVQYPYGFNELQADNPYTRFSTTDVPTAFQGTEKNLSGETLIAVAMTDKPSYDADTQVVEEGQPENVGGIWTQRWNVRAMTAAELAARKATRNTNRRRQIADLELSSVAEVRGAVLGTAGADGRLRALDNQIKALQGQIES